MAKFSGVVGYGEQQEISPDVYDEVIVEYPYYGDITKNSRVARDEGNVNQSLSVQNTISIVADAYAREHFHAIKYVKWAGTYWTVSEVTVERPRLLLRLGEVYNGRKATAQPTTP